MARSRSPKYPMWSLPQALQRVRKIYEAEPHNTMTAAAMAQHMGYQSLSGTAAKALSALKKFGLVDGRADGLRLSKDALTIFSEESAEDQSLRADALRRAATSDRLFGELAALYKGVPAEATLTSYLIREGFNPKAAKEAAANYRATMEYVEGTELRYNVARKDVEHQEDNGTVTPQSPESVPVRLPLAPGKWATLSANFPLTKQEWDSMESVLQAMKPALSPEAAASKGPKPKQDDSAG